MLVAIIGRHSARTTEAGAARAVIGFTLMAEITDRSMFDEEARTNNSLFSKNRMGLSPFGPCIWVASPRELDPATEVTLTVNGTLRQKFSVGDFAHSVAAAVRAWSRAVLEPGDGVGLGAAICAQERRQHGGFAHPHRRRRHDRGRLRADRHVARALRLLREE